MKPKTDTLIKEIINDYAYTFTQLKEYDMEKKSKSDFKAKEIDKAIRLAWGSLESHLIYTHSGRLIRDEDREFHKKCVEEYADIIKVLSQLY